MPDPVGEGSGFQDVMFIWQLVMGSFTYGGVTVVAEVAGGVFATFLGLFLGWKIILWAKRVLGRVG